MIYVITLLFFAALSTFWFSAMRAKELAVRVCKNACEQRNLQLLDDTVALKKIFLRRVERGHLQVHRIYQFEYLDDYNTRQTNSILLSGNNVIELGFKQQSNVVDFSRAKNDQTYS